MLFDIFPCFGGISIFLGPIDIGWHFVCGESASVLGIEAPFTSGRFFRFVDQNLQSFPLFDVELGEEELLLVFDKGVDRFDRSQEVWVGDGVPFNAVSTASVSYATIEIEILRVDGSHAGNTIALQSLGDIAAGLQLRGFDIVNIPFLFAQPIGIASHRCSMQHEFLAMERVLSEEKGILDEVNAIDSAQPGCIRKELMGIDEGSDHIGHEYF